MLKVLECEIETQVSFAFGFAEANYFRFQHDDDDEVFYKKMSRIFLTLNLLTNIKQHIVPSCKKYMNKIQLLIR